jgi:hypothetical protein
VIDERDVFEAIVRRVGQPSPTARVLAATLVDDGACWTGAWREAQIRCGRYIEGTCRIGGRRVRAHAWVEVDGPLGSMVVECTRGYENATHYLGVAIDSTPGGEVDRATRNWGDDRCSVIEASVAVGDWFPADERTIR